MRSFIVGLSIVAILGVSHVDAQVPTPPSFVMPCAGCHGSDGIGRDRSIPNLAGQSRDYLASQLRAFRSGQRQHPTMNYFAVQATREELQQIVDYYSALPRS
jgi:cytochrome c553